MRELTAEHFDDFFHDLWCKETTHRVPQCFTPFPWQSELARRVAEARPGDSYSCWPQALALPTAAGKTACVDMAIFALACQADRAPGERTAPRRLFFVVDRRVIVDETFERARNLAEKLRDARKDTGGILKKVADSLCSLTQSGDEDDPLACFLLRGGMYRDDAWARSPLQPTVVVTTVDQFGSRLLFRGYGSSPGMRPVHAGLAANDCLVLLDEAHCANPFRQTVSSVQRYREWASQLCNIGSIPFHLTLISATPPQDMRDEERFTAGDEDRKHPVLGRRINASKPTRLVPVRNRRGSTSVGDDARDLPEENAADGRQAESERRRRARERQELECLAETIASEAVSLAGPQRKAIGVMVNRVATAKLVYENLRKADKDATLLTGRMRAIDRDDVVRDLYPLKTGEEREERTRFIVATQTLEVGADLDFDGLVTECASLDALRQRFGRLNRDGRDIEAQAVIVIRADQTNPKNKTADDPVYGTALAETWQWLNHKAGKDIIDFGYGNMDGIVPTDEEELNKLTQQAADAPVMLPAHLDAWVQTSPVPTPDPDPAIFLHGRTLGAPEVQVCWRADLAREDMLDAERAVGIVSLCPPVSTECISVPIHVLCRWLGGTYSGPDTEDSDLEGAFLPDEDSPRERGGSQHAALRWSGPTEGRLIVSRADLRPGDTVVIPAETGGWDVFGHIPPNHVKDLGGRAHLQSRDKPLLRIHPKVVEWWPEVPAKAFFQIIARKPQSSEDWDDLEAQIPESLDKLAVEITEIEDTRQREQWRWLEKSAEALAKEYKRGRRPKMTPYPEPETREADDEVYGFVLQGSRRLYQYTSSTLTSEDDSYSATVWVPLDDHLEGVERWVKGIGEGAGLPDSLAADLALAARWHDAGKADPRFQALLHGGNPWAAGPPLVAKSGRLPTARREYERARQQSGYPKGGRHEMLSVRMLENSGLSKAANDEDLVLHLVASHHGRCRPFAPVVGDSNPVEVEETILGRQMSARSDTGLERLGSGVTERFWRLVSRYGWWGLAWLEALMRLADHRCSEEEQKKHDDADSQAKETAK